MTGKRRSGLFSDIAEIALAYAVDPTGKGAIAAAGKRGIALLASWLEIDRGSRLDQTVDRVCDGLDDFATREGLTGDQAHAAGDNAKKLLRKHALGPAALAECAFDPERAARAVLNPAAANLDRMGEPESGWVRALVATTYRLLLNDPDALREMEGAFRRALLGRLATISTELTAQPPAVARALRKAAAAAMIDDGRQKWVKDRCPPSALLDAHYQVVPFRSRRAEITSLDDWCADGRPVAVRLYTGGGGMGKTRLLLHYAQLLRERGWQAGFFAGGGALPSGVLDALIEQPPRLLLVFDYAETQRDALIPALHRAASTDSRRRVRLVLLARDAADWWDELKLQGAGVGHLLQSPATEHHELRPVEGTEHGQSDAFGDAFEAFSAALGSATAMTPSPDLTAPHFASVLYIHIAALAAVERRTINDREPLLQFAYDREKRFWGERAPRGLSTKAMAQAAAFATMMGGADDEVGARLLLSVTPLLAGQPEDTVGQVAEVLHALYPGRRWLNGVQPDLLGEYLIRRHSENAL